MVINSAPNPTINGWPVYYALIDKEAVPIERPTRSQVLKVWYKSLEDNQVALDRIGNVFISTAFIGVNVNFGEGLPLLFETMICGKDYDKKKWRYSTYSEAVEGHKKAVEMVKVKS